jgi:hypothetical protein
MPVEIKIQRPTPYSEFASANAEIVRSITQRSLLNAWLRLYCEKNAPPRFEDYHPGLPPDEAKDIICYTVTYSGETPLIRIDSFGKRMSIAYGVAAAGCDLAEYVGPKLAPLIMPNYYACIARRLPIYTISTAEDVHGRSVDFERLLMPFEDNGIINRIMAWVETISEDGGFEIRNLMRSDDTLRTYKQRAVIDRDLFYHPPSRIPTNDIIEFD